MAASSSSFAAWIPRPAPFNSSKHGTRVDFSEQCSVAERVRPDKSTWNTVVYTAQPLPVGEMWRITVLSVSIYKWSTGLVLGLTTQVPSDVPSTLPTLNAGPQEWISCGKSTLHDKQRSKFPDVPCLNELTPGQSVELLVTSNGQLHFYVDGQHHHVIATGLPVDTPLWGAASVYGRCTKIKSEIMSVMEAVVLYDYEKQEDDELDLKVGMVIQNVTEAEGEDEWYEGTCDGLTGLFPVTLIRFQPVSPQPPPPPSIKPKPTPSAPPVITRPAELPQLQSVGVPRRYSVNYVCRGPSLPSLKSPRADLGISHISSGGQQMVESLQEKQEEKDAEIQTLTCNAELQQKMTDILVKEDEKQRATQERDGPFSPTEPKKALTPDEPLKSTIAMSDLVLSKDRLGGGAQGMVFRGTWRGIQVAVKKCLQPDPRDVSILLSLGSHSNIIRLYGVIVEEISCLIVTELVEGGSLYDFLHKLKKVPSNEQRSYWMKDIATGMEFLHYQGIAHRDLKSGNVLLGDRKTAKLCDFGRARSLDYTATQSAATGTYRWMAPEIVDDPDARINKKCDVYSYGMVMYELITLKLPFHEVTGQRAMINATMGKRPFLPEPDSDCPSFLNHLITACWDGDPKVRPSFVEINIALDTKTFPQ